VLPGLGRDAVVRGDDEDGVVRLGRAGDGVFHEVLVTRAVDDGEVGGVRAELLVGDVDGDPALPFLGEFVHHVGELEAALTLLLGFLAVALDDVFGNASGLVQQSADERALAVVDVADDGQVLVRSVGHGSHVGMRVLTQKVLGSYGQHLHGAPKWPPWRPPRPVTAPGVPQVPWPWVARVEV